MFLKHKPKKTELHDKIESLETMLDEALSVHYIDFQPYADHISWPVGETRNLDGNLSTKTYEDKHHMTFKVIIPPGTSFRIQWHDMIEHTIIVDGEMVDRRTGQTWGKGKVATYPAGIKHVPGNSSDAHPLIVLVTFLNPHL